MFSSCTCFYQIWKDKNNKAGKLKQLNDVFETIHYDYVYDYDCVYDYGYDYYWRNNDNQTKSLLLLAFVRTL